MAQTGADIARVRIVTADGSEPVEMPKSTECWTESERKAEVHRWARVPCSLEQGQKNAGGHG